MPLNDTSYLIDILDAARLVQTFVSGVEQEAFERDLMRQSAVIRQIEIIGIVIAGVVASQHRPERAPAPRTDAAVVLKPRSRMAR